MSEHNNMHDLDETADRTVAAINKVDTKVTEMRQRRMADPDTLGDKALKMIIPSLAGLVGGKLFQMVWNSVMARVHPSPDDDAKDQQQGLRMSGVFAAASAAFGTLLTRLSDKGANSLVHHMQIKRSR